jgi:hypothetical protein
MPVTNIDKNAGLADYATTAGWSGHQLTSPGLSKSIGKGTFLRTPKTVKNSHVRWHFWQSGMILLLDFHTSFGTNRISHLNGAAMPIRPSARIASVRLASCQFGQHSA